MSVVRCFTLVGDSNIRRNINSVNWKDRPLMKSSQVIVCKKMALLSESLKQVREASNICVVSCVSNFFADAPEEEDGGSSTARTRVEPVLLEFRDRILEFCSGRPDCRVMITPPMYRLRPLWYREGLSDILSLFSELMSDGRPKNLDVLPSFSLPELENDGVHLTSYSGLQYVLHIFDSCFAVLDRPELQEDVRVAKADESGRLLLDKFVVLERDHQRLDHAFELKTAIDAEYRAFLENQQHEDHLLISGLQQAPSDLTGKDWQSYVKNQLDIVFKEVIGRSCPVIFVQNNTSRVRGAETLYQVRLEKIEDSRAIRSRFGFYFQGGKDSRPDSLKSVSIRNWVTHDTRVRLAIMKILGQRFIDTNQGYRMRLVSYESRPSLHLTPPESSKEKRVKRYSFIEAVTKMSTSLSASEINTVMKAVGGKFGGQLRSLFVVITDDMRQSRAQPAQSTGGSSDEVVVESESTSESVAGSNPSITRKRGAPTERDSRAAKSHRV